jgi:hypothetical protein
MMTTRTLVLDPPRWLGLVGEECRPIERSGPIDLGASDLTEQIDWPPTE